VPRPPNEIRNVNPPTGPELPRSKSRGGAVQKAVAVPRDGVGRRAPGTARRGGLCRVGIDARHLSRSGPRQAVLDALYFALHHGATPQTYQLPLAAAAPA